MPPVSVLAVRLSLIYLVTGTAIGAIMLSGRSLDLPGWIYLLRPLHVEMLLFGFMITLAFGVAFWILPRTPSSTSAWPVMVAVALLSVGLWLVGLGPITGLGGLEPAGRLCQLLAIASFGAHAWPRVRPVIQRQ